MARATNNGAINRRDKVILVASVIGLPVALSCDYWAVSNLVEAVILRGERLRNEGECRLA